MFLNKAQLRLLALEGLRDGERGWESVAEIVRILEGNREAEAYQNGYEAGCSERRSKNKPAVRRRRGGNF